MGALLTTGIFAVEGNLSPRDLPPSNDGRMEGGRRMEGATAGCTGVCGAAAGCAAGAVAGCGRRQNVRQEVLDAYTTNIISSRDK
jgi:hypothetical protein